jgi:hypothetical protein
LARMNQGRHPSKPCIVYVSGKGAWYGKVENPMRVGDTVKAVSPGHSSVDALKLVCLHCQFALCGFGEVGVKQQEGYLG